MSRWISLSKLADESGCAVRTLQYMRAQEPAVLTVRQRGKVVEYKQPDCIIAIRKRDTEKALRDATPVTLDDARARKANAEAELAEMDVAKARGEFVAVADYETALGRVLDREMARLRSLAVRLSRFGPDVEAACESEIERMIGEMAAFDEDVIDETIPPTERAA